MTKKEEKRPEEGEFEVSGPPTQLDHRFDPADIPPELRSKFPGLVGVSDEDTTNLNVCSVSEDEADDASDDMYVPTERMPVGLGLPTEDRTRLDIMTPDESIAGRSRMGRTRGGVSPEPSSSVLPTMPLSSERAEELAAQHALSDHSTAPSIRALLDPIEDDKPTYQVMAAFDSRRQSEELALLVGNQGWTGPVVEADIKDTAKELKAFDVPPRSPRTSPVSAEDHSTNPEVVAHEDVEEFPDRPPPEPWSEVEPKTPDAESMQSPKLPPRRLDTAGKQQRSADILYSGMAPSVQQQKMTEPMGADPYKSAPRPRKPPPTPTLIQWLPVGVVMLLGLWVTLSVVAFVKASDSNTGALAAVLSVAAVSLVVIATKVARLSALVRAVAHFVVAAGLSGLTVVSFAVDVLNHTSQIVILSIASLLMVASAIGELVTHSRRR